DRQLFGGSSPFRPRSGRNQNNSRAAEPGPAASASRNQGCAAEQWLGTTSMMTRSPSACASAMSASASASVPKAGSMSRKSETSYPASAIGDGYHGSNQIAS